MRRVKSAVKWTVGMMLAILILGFAFHPGTAYAANANASVLADRTEASVGDTVAVTVRVESDGPALGELSFQIDYSSAILSITDSSGQSFNGSLYWATAPVGSNTYAETFTFSVIKEGTAKIEFASLNVEDENGEEMTPVFTAGEAWLTVSDGAAAAAAEANEEQPAEEAAAEQPAEEQPVEEAPVEEEQPAEQTEQSEISTENLSSCDLVSLTISPGSLDFDPAVTDYTVEVDNDVTRLTVSAVTADETSTYVVEDYDNFEVGENIVTIHVTAQDGTSKDYVIHVLRAGEAGEEVPETEEPETIEGFEWIVPETSYYITVFPDDVTIPDGFSFTTVVIGNYEVPSYANLEENPNYYLIYAVKEGEEEGGLHWFCSLDDSVFPYIPAVETASESEFPSWILTACLVVIVVILLILLIAQLRRRRASEDEEYASVKPEKRSRFRRSFDDDDDDDDDDEEDDRKESLREEETEEEYDEDFDSDFDEDDEDDDDESFVPSTDDGQNSGSEEEQKDDFGIDIKLMQEGIEREMAALGPDLGADSSGKTARPKKPPVNSSRVNEASTGKDAEALRKNKENKKE